MLSQLAGRVTIEMQENNEMCCRVIRFQEELIAEYGSKQQIAAYFLAIGL